MSARQISRPPDLPGFSFVEVIGSGGYADVFLYEQVSPRREVAIKVLDASLLPAGSAADYTDEADVMAMVSSHPFIVQVFDAGISPDGRPYLIMEYYPGQNFQQRARREHFAVSEVLRVGIQIASAVETAHSAKILHRDIKPANILTSKFRKPGLTDFGIAAVDGPDSADSDAGLSIPWSPPEAMGAVVTDRRADVYSLAASCYTMLTGRSPFEIPNGDNRFVALMNRIERDPVPSIGRPDVPKRLERVLEIAMSKDQRHRPDTAADFARQLQEIESELRLPVTELELEDLGRQVRTRSGEPDDDATRAKTITTVEAQAPPAPTPPAPAPTPETIISQVGGSPMEHAAPQPRARQGLLGEPEIDATVQRAATEQISAEPVLDREPDRTPKIYLVAAAAAAVLALVVGAVVLTGGGEAGPENDAQTDIAEVNDNFGDDVGAPVAVAPLAVERVEGSLLDNGLYEFSWAEQGSDVTYAIRVGDADVTTESDATTFVGTERCIEVEVIAPSGLISAPTRGCAAE